MRSNLFFIGFFISLIMLFTQCTSNYNNTNNKDRELLDSLKEVCFINKYTPALINSALTLKEEAEKQNDDLYIGHAYSYIQKYYQQAANGANAADSVHFYQQKAIDHYTKGGYQHEILRVEINMLRWEIDDGNMNQTFSRIFDLIAQAEKFEGSDKIDILQEAYSTLGWAYLMSNNLKEAYNSFQKELEYTKMLDPTQYSLSAIHTKYALSFMELSNTSIFMNKDSLGVVYCDSANLYLNELPESPILSAFRLQSDLLRLYAFSKLGNIEEASPIAEQLQPIINTLNKTDIAYAQSQLVLAEYYYQQKEYDKALQAISEAIAFYQTLNKYDQDLNTGKEIKAKIHAAKKQFGEAYKLVDELTVYTDSIDQVNSTRQLKELQTMYNVEKVEKNAMENEAKAHQTRMLVIALIVICLSLAIVVTIIILNQNRLKNKNKKIFTQYQDIDKYRLLIDQLNSGQDVKENSDTEDDNLFHKIEQYLQQTHDYTDANITREALALQVATNRQYLIQAIQEGAGMTFNEYINHYRLEYARQELAQNTEKTIEEVYQSAGFIHKSTFYRLFKEKYNLTPKEVRDFALSQLSSNE